MTMYDGAPILPAVFYGYRQPRSQVVLAECTKAFAFGRIASGAYPKGCIWVPGPCSGRDARPEVGDLFGPDPAWTAPFLLNAVPDDHLPWRREI